VDDDVSPLRAVVRRFGRPTEVVELDRRDLGRPPPGHVRVRMRRCSINPSDLVAIAGAYPSRTPLPFVPGFEGVGLVEEVAADVHRPAVGDRVLPIGSDGAWQEVKTTEARWCFAIDPRLTDEQAATSYVNPLTALLMVDRHVPEGPGAWVAVDAAASAIGLMLIRLMNRRGVRPIALVRRPESRERLAGTATSAVLCTGEGDVTDEIGALTRGRGLDVAFDAVGGDDCASLTCSLRSRGTLVRYGLLSGRQPSPDPSELRADVDVVPFWLRRWVHQTGRERIADALARTFELVRDGTAATAVEATYPLAAIGDALHHQDSAARRGKILLRPG
jgi:NADPH:quinone reductase-like Zn-dependent oxidoreductase